MNKYCVYKHINKINGKIYIGITSKPINERWKNGYGYQRGTHFRNAIDKYGWNNFDHEIILDNLSEDQAKSKEIELIKFYNSNNRIYGYNTTNGGDGVSGLKHSSETKKKLSEIQKGIRKSPKTEFKKGIIPWNKGLKFTEQHKKALSEAHKGKISPRRKKVICVETGVIYDSVTLAAKSVNDYSSHISKVCKGIHNTCKGLHWQYYN